MIMMIMFMMMIISDGDADSRRLKDKTNKKNKVI